MPPISRVVFDNITNYSATIPILQARQAARLAIKTGNVPQHVEIPHSLKNVSYKKATYSAFFYTFIKF